MGGPGQERAPGGFPVQIGRGVFERIQSAYEVFGAKPAVVFTVHEGGHVFVGRDFWPLVRRELGMPRTPMPDPGRYGHRPNPRLHNRHPNRDRGASHNHPQHHNPMVRTDK